MLRQLVAAEPGERSTHQDLAHLPVWVQLDYKVNVAPLVDLRGWGVGPAAAARLAAAGEQLCRKARAAGWQRMESDVLWPACQPASIPTGSQPLQIHADAHVQEPYRSWLLSQHLKMHTPSQPTLNRRWQALPPLPTPAAPAHGHFWMEELQQHRLSLTA